MKRSITASALFALVSGVLALLYVWRNSSQVRRSGTDRQDVGEHPSALSEGATVKGYPSWAAMKSSRASSLRNCFAIGAFANE